MKFRVGDEIRVKDYVRGFEGGKIIRITTDKKYYVLKIINGTATIPVSTENNYDLVE